MLAVFPLTTARDRRWWSHWRSLDSPDASTSFFVRPLKNGSGLSIHTSGLNCHWLKVVIALEVMIFLAFCDLSFCGRKTSLSGIVFIVALSKSVHSCCVTHQAPPSVPGAQSQAIRPPSICVCLEKNFICFIDLICARCGKTNILLVKRRKYCTHF